MIVGAGHGIGAALVESIIEAQPQTQIFASYRNSVKSAPLQKLHQRHTDRLSTHRMDPTQEDAIMEWASHIKTQTRQIDLLINSVGLLHNTHLSPEKNLNDINSAHLLELFSVNSIVTPVLAKHFKPFFKNNHPSCFAAISAKVGSIDDNRMGGWYGYRASKAALNMFIKNIAIEYKRYHCNTSVLAIHPGTTKTELSSPFIAKTNYQLHTPQETAHNILEVLQGKDLNQSGIFYSWDGKTIAW